MADPINTAAIDNIDPTLVERIRHFNLWKEEGTSREDINELFGVMRERCPISFADENGGHYTVADYAEIRRSLQNWEVFSSAQGVMTPRTPWRMPPIEMDPPDWRTWRNLIQPDLTETRVLKFESNIRDDVTRLIDGFIADGRCDLVSDFAKILPVLAVCDVIGVRHRADEVGSLTEQFVQALEYPEQLEQVSSQFRGLLTEELEDRKKQPRDDLLTRFGETRVDGQLLTADHLLIFVQTLLAAGNSTTISGLSTLLLTLLSDPTLREAIEQDPDLIDNAVDENLRLNPPLLQFSRTTTAEATVCKHRIPAGSSVMFLYAAANRDPEVFENPSEFRLDRAVKNRHLSFGFGIHRCVGSQLARLEMKIAVQEVFRRLRDVKLAVPPESISCYVHSGVEYVVDSLPVEFTPGTPE